MIEKDLRGKLVQLRLMVRANTGKAVFILIEAGQLRQSIPQPVTDLGAVSAGPVNTTKFQPCKSDMFLACRLHIILCPQEIGKLKLVPNRVAKLHAEQHVGILDRALPVLLAPIPAFIPAEMDLVED